MAPSICFREYDCFVPFLDFFFFFIFRVDVSGDKESKGHVKHLPSGSSTLGKFEAGLQSDTLAVEDGSSSFKISGLSKEQTKSCVNDDHSKYPKLGYHFFPYEENRNTKSAVDGKYTEAMPEKKSEIMDARNTKPFSVPGKGAAVVIPMRDVFGEEATIVQCSNKEIKQIDFQSPEEMNQRASRWGVTGSESSGILLSMQLKVLD